MSVSGNSMNHVIYLLSLQIGKKPCRGEDAGKSQTHTISHILHSLRKTYFNQT